MYTHHAISPYTYAEDHVLLKMSIILLPQITDRYLFSNSYYNNISPQFKITGRSHNGQFPLGFHTWGP